MSKNALYLFTGLIILIVVWLILISLKIYSPSFGVIQQNTVSTPSPMEPSVQPSSSPTPLVSSSPTTTQQVSPTLPVTVKPSTGY